MPSRHLPYVFFFFFFFFKDKQRERKKRKVGEVEGLGAGNTLRKK